LFCRQERPVKPTDPVSLKHFKLAGPFFRQIPVTIL